MQYEQPFGSSDVNAPYVNGDPSIGRSGSIPPAACFENHMRELVALIQNVGITPDRGDLTQVWKALQLAPWQQAYAADTGTTNALVAALNPVPPSLILGTTIRIKVLNTNTGPTTLALNAFGVFNVKRANGAALVAGDLSAGQVAQLQWTGSEWQTTNYLGSAAPSGTNNFLINLPSAIDSGTVNHVIANFSPDIAAWAFGAIVTIKAAFTNTGPTDCVADAQAAKAIVRPDGAPLQAGDIVAGMMMLLQFDGTALQLTNPIKWFTDSVGGGSGGFVPGCIYTWPTEVAPAGTLECDGSSVSRTTFSRLFGIIQTSFGPGNGTSTYRLPDLRGKFIRGWDHGAGQDPNRNARTDRGDGTIGDHIGTLQGDALANHDHIVTNATVQGSDPVKDKPFFYGHGPSQNLQDQFPGIGDTGAGASSFTLQKSYFDGLQFTLTTPQAAAENRPKNVNMMFVIAV